MLIAIFSCNGFTSVKCKNLVHVHVVKQLTNNKYESDSEER